MCGICGYVDRHGRAASAVAESMAERLAHRGPDSSGSWRDPEGTAVLAHRRLAVLDLSDSARQPMVAPSGQVLCYNGEIYNYRELRDQLSEEGWSFSSSGDTEVLLAALCRWGVEALERCNGMFAVAFWDPEARRLVLARDRLGIKPLFWAATASGVAFASEVPALLRHPEVARDLESDALAKWLQSGYLGGEETLCAGVRRLPPGHLAEVDADGVRVRCWYDLVERVRVPRVAERGVVLDELERLVRDAVRLRLVSDVPLGCFLSGGVDSSLVAAAAARRQPQLETLTVDFVGGSDESCIAARTAEALGIAHRRLQCTPDTMLELLPHWPEVAGDPLADPSLFPSWQISRSARRSWTVALSGDGGDELLSGYPRLRFMPRFESLGGLGRIGGRLAAPLTPRRRWGEKLRGAVRSGSRWEAYQALHGVWPAALAARLTGRARVPLPWAAPLLERLDRESPWRRYRLLDLLHFLPERVLAKADRASMAHGLELRVPLLDHRVVEHLLRLPDRWTHNKDLLRELASRLGVPRLPAAKRGFEIPLGRWLRGGLRDAVAHDLQGPRVDELGFDQAILRQLWEEHQSGRADHGERLLSVALLVRWVATWL